MPNRIVGGMSRPTSLIAAAPMHETKQRLLETGLQLMLAHGYHALGVQGLLDATGIPKGSFYHHFASKEDFALQAIDAYMGKVHQLLDTTLGDSRVPPLARIRGFFEQVRTAYESEGFLGCFLGALGQELSGASDVFRRKIDGCIARIAGRLAVCLEEARIRGDLSAATDPKAMADVLVNAWEGAALRSRLTRTAEPLSAMLDFYFASVAMR